MNGTYGRYTKNTMDNNSIPRLFVPTCHCLFMHSPLCAADVPWSFGSLLFWIVTFLFVFSPSMTHPPTCWRIRQEWSWRWLLASCILPWCPFLDAFCTLSIYPSMFFSLYVNTCSRSRTSLHVAVLFLAIPTARCSLYVIKAL
jgi:hypothetical protein